MNCKCVCVGSECICCGRRCRSCRCLTVVEKRALWNVMTAGSFIRSHAPNNIRQFGEVYVSVCVCARTVDCLVRMNLIRQSIESTSGKWLFSVEFIHFALFAANLHDTVDLF